MSRHFGARADEGDDVEFFQRFETDAAKRINRRTAALGLRSVASAAKAFDALSGRVGSEISRWFVWRNQ